MSNLSLFEKLELKDEKNLLIQGLPSSIEKQFAKLSYAKNVTPLLKTKKVDFALVFAVNQNQLHNVLKEIFPALHNESKLWIAYPKETSKIVSDLSRECSWDILAANSFEGVSLVALDHVWSAMRFKKNDVPVTTTTAKKPVKQTAEAVEVFEVEVEEEIVVTTKRRTTVSRKKAAV